MSIRQKVLICGASIAGPCLAYWLTRYGFDVTVIERAPSLRMGGQNIDIKGSGRKIIRMMGVEDQIKEANTGEEGLQFVDERNIVKAEFPKGSATSLTSEIEILRGDLSNIFYTLTKTEAKYRFGTYVTKLAQTGEEVIVTFNGDGQEQFDLLIAADGIGSSTRTIIFGNEPRLKYLGYQTSYLTIPRVMTDTQWARWYTAPSAMVVLLRPDNKGLTRASVIFSDPDYVYEPTSETEKRQVLKNVLKGAGWECDRIAAALDDVDDIYIGPLSQVKAPRWASGRCGMVGDAAYCPSPLTGMGTTLAIVGAYVLAGELFRQKEYGAAFRSYETLMRPYVEKVQKLPPGVPRIAYPKTKTGVWLLNNVAKIFASRPVQKLISLLSGQPKSDTDNDDGFVLPEYLTH